jgi:hypothetical protein
MLGEEYKLRSSSLCNIFQLLITSFFFGQKYSSQHLVLKHPQSMFLP